jgi:hypothetical protein
MVAIGREYVAILSTNERGPIEHRPARTWSEACAAAHQLLDLVEHGQWHQGEIVLVEVRQSDD